MSQHIIVLGTGGTIAGTAASSGDQTGYTAAQLGVDALLKCVPGLQEALGGCELHSEQVAQLDSKDMGFDTMLRLAQRCAFHLAREEVKAVVITHGTDTLEETAYFLYRAFPHELLGKPIVMTCAMRPATSNEADGPGNLRDAVQVAGDALSRGVLVVCAGQVHHALAVQKIHSYAPDAFASGDMSLGELGAVARVARDEIAWSASYPAFFESNQPTTHINIESIAIELIANQRDVWPRVEIVMNHSQATGAVVRALLADSKRSASPLRGIVVAATGNGTVSQDLQAALEAAQKQGVTVVLASRCAWGGVRDNDVCIQPLSAVKARIALMVQLLA